MIFHHHLLDFKDDDPISPRNGKSPGLFYQGTRPNVQTGPSLVDRPIRAALVAKGNEQATLENPVTHVTSISRPILSPSL
jgi:hypothetical protein